MECPDAVKRLIERFNHQSDQVRSPDYNETQLRIDFINPLFRELGWDMDNASGYAEQYREVVHEDRVKIAGTTKAPDYSFRIGGIRKFFLEAKKPAINIKEAWEPAYQLRRYAWSAKLPVSILTDFEELAIYDCRIAPKQMDKPATARREYISYTDYCDRWDFLYGTFSKEAVLKGDFDRYCASQKGRGAQEFDEAFLIEIEEWRKKLASNLALRNELTEHNLNFATQRIIDRVIFLRICEDRGVEPAGHLQQLLNGDNTYKRLVSLFRDADARYNSGLFHFKRETGREEAPDELTLDLEVDDGALKTILKRLYYPESPYEFTVVSADILGSVYERFLGNIIERRGEHGIKVVEKPEVRKAGGVYYTPTYIVDYIVKQTVGKLLEGKTPKEAAKLKVLDPACGSGSFLLGAYQYLLDWHLKWYVADGPQKWSKGKTATIRPADRPSFTAGNAGSIAPSGAGDTSPAALTPEQTRELGHWGLTIAERKRILLDNIHGVDIDYQAVEVTKLSLLLRCLEGETAESVRAFSTLFRERALPDLGHNIQCGNSLIGTDVMTSDAWKEMSEEERSRINPFDYERGFRQVFKLGGFDAVIGNPPWGAALHPPELEYIKERHRSVIVRMIDSFMFFFNKALLLARTSGAVGMILPDVVLYQVDNAALRRRILSESRLRIAANLGEVFGQVTRPSAIIITERNKPGGTVEAIEISATEFGAKKLTLNDKAFASTIKTELYASLPGNIFVTDRVDLYQLFQRLQAKHASRLAAVVDDDGIQRGVSPDFQDAFVVTRDVASKQKLEPSALRPTVTGGRQVKRYHVANTDLLLIYTSRDSDFKKLPRICRYINGFRDQITCKEVREGKHPLYSLHRPRDPSIFEKRSKLVGVITSDRLIIARDRDRLFPTDGLFLFAVRDLKSEGPVLAILNSRLATVLYRLISLETNRVLAQVKPAILEQIPLPGAVSNGTSPAIRRLGELADSMLSLHASEAAAKHPQKKEQLRRRIEATDRQIDQLVYQLYGLTEDEIKLVEQSTQPAGD